VRSLKVLRFRFSVAPPDQARAAALNRPPAWLQAYAGSVLVGGGGGGGGASGGRSPPEAAGVSLQVSSVTRGW
jgi:hypothetical protein